MPVLTSFPSPLALSMYRCIYQVEFSITLQKEFNLPDMSEEDFAGLKTVGDVVKFIEGMKK